MYFTHTVSSDLDAKWQVDSIYTDFAKAFDRIDHGILINKLQSFSFSDPLISLLSSYLYQRKLFVQHNGHSSFNFLASSGVPQGLNLGPLLFLLFINDITNIIKCDKLLFADDLKIFHPISSACDCELLQEDLNRISQWCTLNNLNLNLNKCHVMSYTRKLSPLKFDYSIRNVALSRVTV